MPNHKSLSGSPHLSTELLSLELLLLKSLLGPLQLLLNPELVLRRLLALRPPLLLDSSQESLQFGGAGLECCV